MQILEGQHVGVDAAGPVAEIMINRPEALNALSPDVLNALLLAFEQVGRAPDIRAVVIFGSGEKAFVAGADIRSMYNLGPRPIAEFLELGQRLMRTIERFPVPVIAAVQGYALGGGMELALACDLIVAADNAKFGQPEVNLGIIPGFGGTQRLIHRCGLGTARRLVYTGELVGAEEAVRIGLADKIAPKESILSESRALANTIASKGPLAIRASKRVMTHAIEQQLLGGLRHEVEAFLDCFATADREEGMAAFLEKREAKFRGV